MNDKNLKLQWISIGVLATVVVIGVAIAVWFGFFKNDSNQQLNQVNNQTNDSQSNQVNNQTNQNLSPTPTSLPVDSMPWKLTLSKDEMKSSTNLVEGNLIYAVRDRDKEDAAYRRGTAMVYKRNLQNGTQTKILEFDDDNKNV